MKASLKNNIGTGDNNEEKVNPSNETPALAKAKTGIIPNATYGDRPCSNLSNIDCLFFLILVGDLQVYRSSN